MTPFEAECEREMQRALKFGEFLQSLSAPKSNVILFPRDSEAANNRPERDQ
jgi:hypothetical protein